ncbi:MAG: O-antigen ligase family protein [Candidatus Eiseniibacteriota bacterium]
MVELAPPAARPPVHLLLPWALGVLALGLIAVFTWSGPHNLEGRIALAALPGLAVLSLPSRFRVWLVPLITLTALFGPIDGRYYVFEPFVAVGALLALRSSLASEDRRTWDLHTPAFLAIAFLAVPLLALLGEIGSMVSYLGWYRLYVIAVVVFFTLRRLVSQEQSDVLLWTFPLLGLVGSLQLAQRTAGLGGLLSTRMLFRNFYTELPWGKSNYVSAVLEFCICMCVVLWFLDRRPLVRAILVAAVVIMFRSFLPLSSRAGALGLLAFALILLFGLANRRTILVAAGSAAALLFGFFSTGGQTLLQRFTDPTEYASWYQRVLLWQFAWERFLTQPLIGTGLNQGRYQGDALGGQSAHNLILDALADQGVLGGIVVLAILIGAYRLCLRAEPYRRPSSLRGVRVALVASLSAVIVHAFFEPVVSSPPILPLLVLVFVWLCLNDSKRVRREPVER